jgi:hypothetical protein
MPAAAVWVWNHFDLEWTTGILVESLPGDFANVIMLGGTLARNLYNVQKWPGTGPLTLTPSDTPSAWYEITNPKPTDPVE